MSTYPVEVMHRDVWRDWRSSNYAGTMRLPLEAPPFAWTGDDKEPSGFMWTCPTCGRSFHGQLGPAAVGGWDGSQRWVNDGTDLRPTLRPSLGCRGMNDGSAGVHHWFLRDGVLEPA
jgi:hypothetical protein